MFFRYKVGKVIILVLACLAMSLNLLNAAWWQEEKILLPPGTEEIKKETRRIGGQEFNFTYYSSTQDAISIKDFYRTKLPNWGWKEKELTRDLSQIPNLKIEPALTTALEQNLIFEKDSNMLIINFLPPEFSKDGKKTQFTVSQGKIDFQALPSSDTNFVPELLTKPKKDVAPTYPGASLITLSEQPRALNATYFTKDDIEQVVAFYKSKMSDYSWYLTEEKPVNKMDTQDFKYDISAYCPSCAKNLGMTPGAIEMWLAQLGFSNSKGDICKIVISTIASTKETPYSMDMTTILVNYEEKK